MQYLPAEFEALLVTEVLTREERNSLFATVIARVTIMAAVVALIYTSVTLPQGVLKERVVLACGIAMLASHFVLVFKGAPSRIRGLILVFGIFAAGFASEVDTSAIFFGRSSLFLAVPAVVASVTLRPRCTIYYWIAIQVVAAATAILTPCEFNIFSALSLLVVCITIWMATVRADKVIGTISEEKRIAEEARKEAETAIGIIVSAEEMRLEHPLWPTEMARKETAERSRT